MNKLIKPLSVLCLLVSSYTSYSQTSYSQTSNGSSGKGIEISNVDNSVSPCDDFFTFVNGGWLKKNPIPASESRWSSFHELDNKNTMIIRKILEDASAKPGPKGSNAQKVGDFYFSGMDSLGIEKSGVTPIKPDLEKIKQAKDREVLLSLNNQNLIRKVGTLFNFNVGQDDKKSTEYAIFFSQGGLGLPDRDYYLNEDKRFQTIKEEYKNYIQKAFALTGTTADNAKKHAELILSIETELAKASMSRVQMRDPHALYNKMTLEEIGKIAPRFNWSKRFEELGIKGTQTLIVQQPEFFKKASRLLDSVSIDSWKTYFQWHFLRQAAPMLSNDFVKAHFRFTGTVLTGAKEMQPRWKRLSRNTNTLLGEALGELYVKAAFSPKAKERAMEMVKNLKLAFKDHVEKADWMSAETKARSLKKLDAFVTKIGYPDKWKDYSTLTIDRGPYVLNSLRAFEFNTRYDLNKLGKPVDRGEWFMSPSTVNAYYNPGMNEIVFPAGILQPPFFNAEADDAVNYGGIGAVIGHEITHGFDDEGRQYDDVGNLSDWWTKEDGEKFEQKAAAVEKQFSGYQVLDSVFINGKLTLGENIADLGGLSIAYTALQRALKDKNPGKIDGFTPEQRLFISWGQIWRVNARDESLRQQVLTDPHSPGKYRTNGPLSNLPEFHKAFNCKPGDKMVTPETNRAKIW